MSARQPERRAPDEAGEHLVRLLERWAERRRLKVSEAEAIRRAIVAAPAELPPEWWHGFRLSLDVALAQAARAFRATRVPLAGARANLPAAAFSAAGPSAVYQQAYLRLA